VPAQSHFSFIPYDHLSEVKKFIHHSSPISTMHLFKHRACSISRRMPSEIPSPVKTQTSSQTSINAFPHAMPASRSESFVSSRNSGYSRCGANGAKPAVTAFWQSRSAVNVFRGMSPAYRLQINTRFMSSILYRSSRSRPRNSVDCHTITRDHWRSIAASAP